MNPTKKIDHNTSYKFWETDSHTSFPKNSFLINNLMILSQQHSSKPCTSLESYCSRAIYRGSLQLPRDAPFDRYAMFNIKNEFSTPCTQDVNWTSIRHSEDVRDVFWTSYVRSIYVLSPWEYVMTLIFWSVKVHDKKVIKSYRKLGHVTGCNTQIRYRFQKKFCYQFHKVIDELIIENRKLITKYCFQYVCFEGYPKGDFFFWMKKIFLNKISKISSPYSLLLFHTVILHYRWVYFVLICINISRELFQYSFISMRNQHKYVDKVQIYMAK